MVEELTVLAERVARSELARTGTRIAHVQGVAAKARQASDLLREEHSEEVVAAAWLHDIGYAENLKDTGFHPIDGARFLEREHFPELVVSLVAHHSGASEEARQRGLLDQLRVFNEPPLELLDLLTFADMSTGPTGHPIDVDSRISEILDRYPSDDPVHRAVSRSSDSLRASVESVQARILRAVTQPK